MDTLDPLHGPLEPLDTLYGPFGTHGPRLGTKALDQGWPDFFDRGPNLKNIFHRGPHNSFMGDF